MEPIRDLVDEQHVADLQRRNHRNRWNVVRPNDERDDEECDQTRNEQRVEIIAYDGGGRRVGASGRERFGRKCDACDRKEAEQAEELQRSQGGLLDGLLFLDARRFSDFFA